RRTRRRRRLCAPRSGSGRRQAGRDSRSHPDVEYEMVKTDSDQHTLETAWAPSDYRTGCVPSENSGDVDGPGAKALFRMGRYVQGWAEQLRAHSRAKGTGLPEQPSEMPARAAGRDMPTACPDLSVGVVFR